jgi:hypothetical protein
MRTLKLFGKTSDMSSMKIIDNDGETIMDHEGYVPHDMCIGGGDYVKLEIDIESGKVIGWNPEKVKTSIAEFLDDNPRSRPRT